MHEMKEEISTAMYNLLHVIYVLVILCSIILVLLICRLCAIIGAFIMKRRKEKARERERLIKKVYEMGKKKAKKHWKNIKQECSSSKKQSISEKFSENTRNRLQIGKSAPTKSAPTTSTCEKSNATCQRTSALSKPGAPFTRTITRVQPSLKEDEVVEEVLHIQFENISDRPPHNSACEYRFIETKWMDKPEDLSNVKDYNTSSRHLHNSKVAGSDSFGTPLSSFSQESAVRQTITSLKTPISESTSKITKDRKGNVTPKTAVVTTTPKTSVEENFTSGTAINCTTAIELGGQKAKKKTATRKRRH